MMTPEEMEKFAAGKVVKHIWNGGDHIEMVFTDDTILNIHGDASWFPAKPAAVSAIDVQEGGDHYKKLGAYQPWEVLRRWLTPEEFRGYMKGTAIAYLAREQDKGGMLDIRKAGHTLQGLVELLGAE